jgi:3-(3-hydroxy-phenyl)propionate hydroxylase
MTRADHVQVLIAGGGPSGMVLAFALASKGISVRVLEGAATCLEDMRASTFHPPTLEMMDKLGLLSILQEQGLKAPSYTYHNRATEKSFSLNLGELSDVTQFPYRLQCEQFKLTRLVTERLSAMPNADVEFSRRLVHFVQDENSVTATAEGAFDLKTYTADYLVGADGANSMVRKWLGIEFDGFTYPESFLTLSTAYPIEKHLPWLSDVNYVADPPNWCVLLRVPGLWRILLPQADDANSAEVLSDARKDKVFRELLGPDAPIIQTEHRTVYRVHQRVAKSFREGRVILAGDAAHLNNPLGGFGMNSGIHDAWSLSQKLQAILLEGADPDEQLGRYDRQRRTVTNSFVQTQTIANKKAMSENFADREAYLEKLVGDGAARREYLLTQSMFQSLAHEASIL